MKDHNVWLCLVKGTLKHVPNRTQMILCKYTVLSVFIFLINCKSKNGKIKTWLFALMQRVICIDAKADLSLYCMRMAKGPFWARHIICFCKHRQFCGITICYHGNEKKYSRIIIRDPTYQELLRTYQIKNTDFCK